MRLSFAWTLQVVIVSLGTKISAKTTENAFSQRELQTYEKIQTYQPETLVTDNVRSTLQYTVSLHANEVQYLLYGTDLTICFCFLSDGIQAAMDLDLAAIQDQFKLGTKIGMATAERIYREGAFSHPVARLRLDAPLSQDVPSGTRVTGLAFSSSADEVEGRTRDFWAKGSTEVYVEYAVTPDQSNVRENWMKFCYRTYSFVEAHRVCLLAVR
jgi:hypothetical protein